MKNFAIIGVAGYIAPRHLEAITQTGHRIVAACDVNDSVGVLDRYAPDAKFFKSTIELEKYLDSLKGTSAEVHYLSICSPNHLHFDHIKLAFRIGADAICEKPVVLSSREISEIKELEKTSGKRVFTVLQLRTHEAIRNLKAAVDASKQTVHEVELTHVSYRGDWYHQSWKGNEKLSGGVATNIGVHFFDMLTWIFGEPKTNEIHLRNDSTAAGYLKLQKANVKWLVSIERKYLPSEKTSYRSLKIDGKEFEFSDGFADLHSTVYNLTLKNEGYGLKDVEAGIRVAEGIRTAAVLGLTSNTHPKIL